MTKIIPYAKQTIDQQDINEVVKVLKSDYLTTGPKIKEFEKALCKNMGSKYCAVVSSGTAALHLGALCLLDKDDKVLTTPNSFIATSNAILYAGAEPIFIDICNDGLIDLDICEDMLKKDNSIKAIFAVSFSGKLLDYKKLNHLKEKYNIKILQDNAHSVGAKFEACDVSTFSFHAIKHITTAEGGAVLTDDEQIYKKIKMLRNHGQDDFHNMLELGFNYRLSDIQCALGISQLKKLDDFIKTRQVLAKRYDELLKNTPLKPLYSFTYKSLYHLYVVRVDFDLLNITKDELFQKAREKNIILQSHYKPINKQPFYKDYSNVSTPVMDRYAKETFSLPLYPLLSYDEQDYVIKTVVEILDEK